MYMYVLRIYVCVIIQYIYIYYIHTYGWVNTHRTMGFDWAMNFQKLPCLSLSICLPGELTRTCLPFGDPWFAGKSPIYR